MSLRPRRVAHRGRVLAYGFHLPDAPAGRDQSKRRVLSSWRSGCRVGELQDGLLLLLAEPVWMDVGHGPGTPLVKVGTKLLSAPLDSDELEALGGGDGIVLVRGGVAAIEQVSTWCDPSQWLELEGWTGVEVASLGARAPVPAQAIAPTKALDTRKTFGIPERSSEADSAISELRERLRTRGATASEPTSVGGSLLGVLARWWAGRGRAEADAGGPPGRPGSTPWSRLAARLNALVVRFLVQTRLAAAIGRRQAKYLARLNDLFESGDLEQALREAIPLGGASAPDQRVSLGLPSPRSTLTLQKHRTQASSTMLLSDDYFGHLRERYRAAARQLEHRGEIEQAAFVYSDLLHEEEAAVVLLEKHGRLRVAAELAEGRGLSSGMVVRQWFLAGDIERAIVIARRTGAFSDAVVRLERTHPEHAERLRIQWADSLAESGDYSAAVRAIWPVSAGRGFAARWIDLGLETGGELEASLLPLKLELSPDAAEEVIRRARRILQDPAPEAGAWRNTLADAVLRGPSRTPATATLARLSARVLMAEIPVVGPRDTRERVKRLVEFSGDAVLRAEVEAASLPKPRQASELPAATFRWVAEDAGPLRCTDVAVLPNGRLLIALGEAGARLMTPDGRTVKTFDVPAYSFAVSDLGHQALAIAPRGESWLVSRLDLHSLKAHGFGLLRATEWARNFGEGMWFVVDGLSVMALDVQAERLRAVWSVRVDEGVVGYLTRSPLELQFLHFPRATPLDEKPRPERWSYQYPGAVLRSRTLIPEALWNDSTDSLLLAPGAIWGWTRTPREGVVQVSVGGRSAELSGTLARLPSLAGKWLPVLLESTSVSGYELVVLNELLEPRLKLLIEGPTSVAARICGNRLAVADTQGRVGVFDLEAGIELRSLRPV